MSQIKYSDEMILDVLLDREEDGEINIKDDLDRLYIKINRIKDIRKNKIDNIKDLRRRLF